MRRLLRGNVIHWMVGLWIGGLVFGLIAGWAFLYFAYDGPDHGERGAVDAGYGAEISTMRAATNSATATELAFPPIVAINTPVSVGATHSAVPTETVTIAPTSTATPQPTPRVHGRGTTVSESVSLWRGVAVLTATHAGTGRFQVTLFDQTGNQIARVASGSGNWTGAASAVIPRDDHYLFEVIADGDWSIQVATIAQDLARLVVPFDYEGTGAEVLTFTAATAGTYRLSCTCHGGTLTIILTNHDGSSRRTLVSTPCPFEGTVAVPIPDAPLGMYILDVIGNESWTLQIE